MTPPRQSNTTAHALALLSEYTHTLDSLPLDLSRNFADLHELDAVLSSSMASMATRVHTLTKMIEENTVPKEDRLWLLTEIAEEAARLKLGGEDKIRVACQAADNLRSHAGHLRNVLEHLPGFDLGVLGRRTTYPHVSARAHVPGPVMDPGRRRRGGYGSILAGSEPSPTKRKRAVRDEDADGNNRSPRKEKVGEGGPQRSRHGARGRRQERAASPAESILSVTSHMPGPYHQTNNPGPSRLGPSQTSNRTGNNPSTTNKRSRNNNTGNSNTSSLPIMQEHGTHDQSNYANATRKPILYAPPTSSSSHPSLPPPYGAPNGIHVYDLSHPVSNGADWVTHPPPGQLEGPGMPVSRAQTHNVMPISTSNPLTSSNVPVTGVPAPSGASATEGTPAEGAEADEDSERYCVCNGPSYGEMIACDDRNCVHEWFHLQCIGLTIPPDGTWFCENCSAKRNARRNGRGGKKRSGAGKASARTANT